MRMWPYDAALTSVLSFPKKPRNNNVAKIAVWSCGKKAPKARDKYQFTIYQPAS